MTATLPPPLPEHHGQCFVLSGRFVMTNDLPDIRLVHGVLRPPDVSVPIGHGWVTYTVDGVTMVLDAVRDMEVPLDVYTEMAGAVEVSSYSRQEAVRWMLDTEDFGPWVRRTEMGVMSS